MLDHLQGMIIIINHQDTPAPINDLHLNPLIIRGISLMNQR